MEKLQIVTSKYRLELSFNKETDKYSDILKEVSKELEKLSVQHFLQNN